MLVERKMGGEKGKTLVLETSCDVKSGKTLWENFVLSY